MIDLCWRCVRILAEARVSKVGISIPEDPEADEWTLCSFAEAIEYATLPMIAGLRIPWRPVRVRTPAMGGWRTLDMVALTTGPNGWRVCAFHSIED